MKYRALATLFGLTFGASMLLPATAHASDSSAPTTPHVERFVNEGQAWLESVLLGPTSRSTPRTKEDAEEDTKAPVMLGSEGAATPFIERMPRASLVLRDWRAVQRVAGPSLVVDDLRPSTSNRVALVRIATDARFSVYGQFGFGEMRIDPALCYGFKGTTAFAAHVGGGFAWQIAKNVDLGAELSYVALRREQQDDPVPPMNGMMQALAAFRATF